MSAQLEYFRILAGTRFPDLLPCAVWIAGLHEVRPVIQHPGAQLPVPFLPRTPAAVQCAEHVPQLTGMPCSEIVSRKVSGKVIDVSVIIVLLLCL